eukprot:scaffold184881_cov24-Tisochrysis_lutea.AAC.3
MPLATSLTVPRPPRFGRWHVCARCSPLHAGHLRCNRGSDRTTISPRKSPSEIASRSVSSMEPRRFRSPPGWLAIQRRERSKG